MGCWECLWFVLELKCLGPCCFWPYFKASLSYWSRLSLKSSWEESLGFARQLGLAQCIRPELGFGLWMQRCIKCQNSMSENLNTRPNFIINHIKFSLCWQMCVTSSVLIYMIKLFFLFIWIPSLQPFLS